MTRVNAQNANSNFFIVLAVWLLFNKFHLIDLGGHINIRAHSFTTTLSQLVGVEAHNLAVAHNDQVAIIFARTLN
jgi:hypothetical protein